MSNLVLKSLEIKNFRAFMHLRIEHLGRVNLIVGKNNVGKSSVLEALLLYGRKGELSLIWNMLGVRDESGTGMSNLPPNAEERTASLRHLFHGRDPIYDYHYPPFVRIGPTNSLIDETFFLGIAPPIASVEKNAKSDSLKIDFDGFELYNDAVFSLVAGFGEKAAYIYPTTSPDPQIITYKTQSKDVNCIQVAANGMAANLSAIFWDAIALTDLEADILVALKLIAEDVERINVVGSNDPFARRHPIVKLRGVKSPVPLRSLGEGMNRMFGIILALVNAKDGMLLIDEVDTGLHYSVLPDLWKLIFEVAHRLNVQVFATSHSWDCIQAFQLAADDNKEEEGVLVRLENRKEGVGAVVFDERDLAIVTREQIEVR